VGFAPPATAAPRGTVWRSCCGGQHHRRATARVIAAAPRPPTSAPRRPNQPRPRSDGCTSARVPDRTSPPGRRAGRAATRH